MSAFYLQINRFLNDSMLIVRDDVFPSILTFFRKTHHAVQLVLDPSKRGYSADKTRLLGRQNAVTRQTKRGYSADKTRLLGRQNAVTRQIKRGYSAEKTRLLGR